MENLNSGQRYILMGGALLLSALMAAGVEAQTGYYKWTDEDGQVHYSQSPPPERKRGEVERLDIKTNKHSQGGVSQTISDAQEGTRPLPDCGSFTFPKQMISPIDRIAQLKTDMAQWQKYVDENSGNTDNKIQERIKDIQCAIDYSKGELERLSDIEERIKENYQQVMDELEELHQTVEACNDPQREENEPEVSVSDCQEKFSKRINELEKVRRNLEASNKTLNQGK